MRQLGVEADKKVIDTLISKMDTNKDGRISKEEFIQFYYLVPTEGLRNAFQYWSKSSSIDLGESFTLPDEEDTSND